MRNPNFDTEGLREWQVSSPRSSKNVVLSSELYVSELLTTTCDSSAHWSWRLCSQIPHWAFQCTFEEEDKGQHELHGVAENLHSQCPIQGRSVLFCGLAKYRGAYVRANLWYVRLPVTTDGGLWTPPLHPSVQIPGGAGGKKTMFYSKFHSGSGRWEKLSVTVPFPPVLKSVTVGIVCGRPGTDVFADACFATTSKRECPLTSLKNEVQRVKRDHIS